MGVCIKGALRFWDACIIFVQCAWSLLLWYMGVRCSPFKFWTNQSVGWEARVRILEQILQLIKLNDEVTKSDSLMWVWQAGTQLGICYKVLVCWLVWGLASVSKPRDVCNVRGVWLWSRACLTWSWASWQEWGGDYDWDLKVRKLWLHLTSRLSRDEAPSLYTFRMRLLCLLNAFDLVTPQGSFSTTDENQTSPCFLFFLNPTPLSFMLTCWFILDKNTLRSQTQAQLRVPRKQNDQKPDKAVNFLKCL